MHTENSFGKLYICPTPIGNIEDITLRCLRILKEVDCILSEDTRITQKILNYYEIKTKLASYHKYSEKQKTSMVIDKLKRGEDIALVTDAGTPAISDPGNDLVRAVLESGLKVVPLPGASSVTCALSASGLAFDGFIFYGFLPKKKNDKKAILEKLSKNDLPIVVFESPNRVIATLEDIYDQFGDVKLFLGREITKRYEELIFDNVLNLIEHFKTSCFKGEFVLILDKIVNDRKTFTDDELEKIILDKLKHNLTLSSIAKELSKDLNINKNRIYQIALSLIDKTD